MPRDDVRWDNRVAIDDGWHTWAELVAEGPTGLLSSASDRVVIVTDGVAEAWRALAAIVETSTDAAIIGAERFDDELARHSREAGFRTLRNGQWGPEPSSQTTPQRGRLTVVTSGTSGTPKFIPHTLASLGTMKGVAAPARRWLCPYGAGSYAWYQCALLGLLVEGQDIVPIQPTEVDGWPERAAQFGITAISATPTFWRRTFLMTDRDTLEKLPLEQISLGGEPVPQTLLDRLRAMYPSARLTHIYASSEAGACIVVSDGKAGFPAEWLDAPRPNGLEIAVKDDKLFLRSPFANTASGHDWIDTGDAVAVRDDRVEIVGRDRGELINVGGAKVSTEEIATVIMQHPSVAWCRVKPRKSPIMGELPIAEVALSRGADASEDDILSWCRSRLAEVALPRMIRFVDEVPASPMLKSGA